MTVDVVIVGAGPSGCAAALSLIRQGCSVALVSAPHKRQRPTETATPALRQVLKSIGADAALTACEPCFGICSDWGRDYVALQSSVMNPFGDAWFIHRSQFDNSLVKLAREAGVVFFEGTALAAEIIDNEVSFRTDDMEIHGQWLVVATGSPQWLAGITRQKVKTVDSLMAFWSLFPVKLESRLLSVEATDYGWWYACPSDTRGTFVCFVTDRENTIDLSPSQPLSWNALFQKTKLKKQLQIEATPLSIQAAKCALACLPQTHGPRWVAVGDAAVKLDPIGSSGTITALESGRRAGRAVFAALQGWSEPFRNYERWSSVLFDAFVNQRSQQYAVQAQKTYTGFWQRRLPQRAEAAGPQFVLA